MPTRGRDHRVRAANTYTPAALGALSDKELLKQHFGSRKHAKNPAHYDAVLAELKRRDIVKPKEPKERIP